MIRFPGIGLLTFVLLAGCGHLGEWPQAEAVSVVSHTSRLVVSPGTLDFGDVSVNQDISGEQSFTVTNLGDEPVTLTGQDEPVGDPQFVVDAAPVMVIAPGETIGIGVTFTPSTEANARADLFILPTGESIELVGHGTAPVAMVATPILPASVVGCTGEVSVPVTNAGSEDLLLLAHSESDEYRLVSAPQRIAPGATENVVLDFLPEAVGQRAGVVTLLTNDPTQPELSVNLSASGVEGNTTGDFFSYAPGNATDFLFVVENDGETADDLARGVGSVAAFVSALRNVNVDFHVGVLTGASACPITDPLYATTWDTAETVTGVMLSGLAGGSGLWDQDLFGLAIASLAHVTQQTCFDDFRREDAELHVVAIADGDSTADVALEVGRLQGIVGDPSRLRVSTIVPGSGDCGVVSADYSDAAAASGGVNVDACDPDWSAGLQRIAASSERAAGVRFALNDVPMVDTLDVRIDGVSWGEWTYDPDANEIVVAGDTRPELGAEVEVRYVSVGVCGG